ncbi:protein angel homolog 1 isoform X1 [Bubalus kerabau]|uniref:protein angel homolog 1 isoform X1 n=1 Tax=Bubalus carabanensis TaxID=3119969 RepID=UPI00244EE03D|nr:protein angel homolog 1 isoform X1 [Bubalus carabanensis]
MIASCLCYLLLPAARLFRALSDAFFTCRKNVFLAKSSSSQVEGNFAMAPRGPDQEECEGLLQQWREEGSSQVLSTVIDGPLVDKGLAESSLALLMDNPGEQDAAPEDKWSSRQLSDLRAAENLEEPFPEVLGEEEPLPEAEGPMWAAVPVQTGPQYTDCAVLPMGALATEQWDEDPAVVAWSIAPEPVPQEEATVWPFEGLGQLQPPPVEIPYHEILWREWEDFSTQPDVQGLEAGDGPQFQFTLMSYNILAQDLMQQSSELYLHCHPDILNWSYRFANLMQEFQHWDPDILCLQEVQEDHYWEQLEPSLRMMGFTCFYKRRTGCKTDGCAVCYKPTRFRLLCASPVEYFRPGLELLNRDNVGLVLLLQPLVPEGLGQVSVAPLCVANTHVLYNPRRGDVKLAQMAILLAEVDKVARLSDGSHCPIVLCGDLNSVPDSPLYNFIRDGELQYHGMPAWKVSGQEDFSHQLHQRRLQAPLWPSSLGVTDHCQYVTSCRPASSERRKYSRDFLLRFRFCSVACRRPVGLVLLEGVTDTKPERPAGWAESVIEEDTSESELDVPSTAALRSPRCPWAWERQWTTSSSQPSPARMGTELIAGCIRMEPSSSWAGSHSSLKRSSGLPTAYPTPSALQTTSAYWLASGWKSPPHDGLPGEERFFSSRRAHRIRDCGNIPRFWKLRSKKLNVPSPPPPHSLLPHG